MTEDIDVREYQVEIDELEDEIACLREALLIVLGHSNCYCEKCRELSRSYWEPGKHPVGNHPSLREINAELLAACEHSMSILTEEERSDWQRSQAYPESPYHDLWIAINQATASREPVKGEAT